MKQNRLPPDERRAVIITAAVEIANAKGLGALAFEDVAENCRVATTKRTIANHFKVAELRRAVIDDCRANQEVLDDAVAMGMRL